MGAVQTTLRYTTLVLGCVYLLCQALFCIGQNQAPQLWLQQASQQFAPAELQTVRAELTPIGRYVFTQLELSFAWQDTTAQQAVFTFANVPAHAIRRFAVQIDTAWAEGLVLESSHQDYHAVHSPALTQQVFGKTITPHFAYTLQNLSPKRLQKIIIEYQTEMQYDGKKWLYELPLPLGKNLQQLQVAITSNLLPTLQTNGLQAFSYEKNNITSTEKNYVFKAQQVSLPKPFVISFPNTNTEQVFVGRSRTQPHYYFYAEIPPCEVESKEKDLPKKMVILYDQSLSGKQRNREAELNVLNRYIKKISEVELQIIGFSHDIVSSKTFQIEGGGFQEVRKYLQQLEFEGGTNLACLPIDSYEADEILIFTDGDSNFGHLPKTKNSRKPLIWLNSRQNTANLTSVPNSTLYELVNASGGQYLDLTKLTLNDASKLLLLQPCQFVGIEYTKEDMSNVQVVRTPTSIQLTGKLLKEMTEVRLKWGYKGKTQTTQALKIQRQTFSKGYYIETVWASIELGVLLKNYETHRKIIQELSKKYNIATQGMSWVVPQNIADYLHYALPIPQHLSWLYRKELSDYYRALPQEKYEESEEAENAFKQIANLYAKRRAWYEKDFLSDEQEEIEYGRTDFSTQDTGEEAGFFWSIEEVLSDSANTARHIKTSPTAKALAFEAHDQYVFELLTDVAVALDENYLLSLQNGDSTQRLKAYRTAKERYGQQAEFYIETANLLFEAGFKQWAVKVLSNVTELFAESPHQLNLIAKQLASMQRYELAVPIYEKILLLMPHNPHTYRDLALCYAEIGENQKAIDYLYEVVANTWEAKYTPLQEMCLGEINNILTNTPQKLNIQNMPSELRKPMPLDIRVVLEWDNPAIDLDLYIIEPTDEKAYYANTSTQIGGLISTHAASGKYNPEEYLLKNAEQGDYLVEIHRYISKKQPQSQASTVATLTYFINYGRPNEEKKVYTYRVSPTQQYVDAEVLSFAAHSKSKERIESRYQTIQCKEYVQLVSRSADNKLIAIAHDYDISIYTADSSKLVQVIKDVSVGGVVFKKMVFNPQGTHLLVLGDSTLINLTDQQDIWETKWEEEGHISVLKLINLQKGVLQKSFSIIDSVIHQIEFLADGKSFVVVGVNGISKVDIVSGKIDKNVIRPNSGKFISSATSTTMIATAERGKITLRHLHNFQSLREIAADSAIDLQIAATSETLAFLQWERNRHIAYVVKWNVSEPLYTINFDLYYQTGIPKIGVFALSPDARFVAAQPYGTNQVIVKAIYEQAEDIIDYYHQNQVTAITFSQDGNFLTSVSKDNVVRSRDMRRLPFSTIKTEGNEFDFALIPAKNWLSIGEENNLRVYQKTTTQFTRFVRLAAVTDSLQDYQPNEILNMVAGNHKDEDYMLCLSKAHKQKVLQIIPFAQTQQQSKQFIQSLRIPLEVFGEKYPLAQTNLVRLSPDAKLVALNEDTLIRLVSIKKLKKAVINDNLLQFYREKCMMTLAGHNADLDKQRIEKPKQSTSITHLSFSHNGEFLLSKGIDRTIRVWSVATGECLATYTLLHDASAVAQFSMNDECILFEDMEYNIKIWNWKTNKIVGELTGHKAPITSLAVDSTGKYFLSSSKDHSIRLWDSQSLECVRTYYDESPRKILFCSPNTFASAGQDTYIKLWRVE